MLDRRTRKKRKHRVCTLGNAPMYILSSSSNRIHLHSVPQTYLALFQKEKNTKDWTSKSQENREKYTERKLFTSFSFSFIGGWQPTWPAQKQSLFVIHVGHFLFLRQLAWTWLGLIYNYELICKMVLWVTLLAISPSPQHMHWCWTSLVM